MKAVGVLLLLQLGATSIIMGVAFFVSHHQLPQPHSEPAAADAGTTVDDPDAGVPWVPLEALKYMSGPWATEDGQVLVSVDTLESVRPIPEPDEFRVQPWRLTIEVADGPTVVCGMYDGVQVSPKQDSVPWRLGYCRGRDVDPGGPAVATRISLLRLPGFEGLRLILGNETDILIYQVH